MNSPLQMEGTDGRSLFDVVALFDPMTCLLTGTFYVLVAGVNDPFQWTVQGDTMGGPYLNNPNSTLLFTTFARHHVVYRGPS